MFRVPKWERMRAWGDSRSLGVIAQARSEARYAAYPRYAVLMALAAWLLEQLPAGTDAMEARVGSPALMFLWCALCVGGTALAAGLSLLGMWRPGRGSVVLSAAALVICCLPVA
jgi:hypothetical protein